MSRRWDNVMARYDQEKVRLSASRTAPSPTQNHAGSKGPSTQPTQR